jgi:hypothetical protein
MEKIKVGDRVKWLEEKVVVPHPEGKLGWEIDVLPVLRDKELTGVVTGLNGKKNTYQVRIDSIYNRLPPEIPSSYDQKIEPSRLTKI